MPKGFPSTEPKKLTFNRFIATYEGKDREVLTYRAGHIARKGRVTAATVKNEAVWRAFIAAGGK